MKKATKHHHQSEIILRLKSTTACLAGNAGKLKTEFSANKKGAVLPMFGLLIIPMMLVAGLALDYSRMINTRTKLGNALDAALVSAGTLVNGGIRDKREIEQKFMEYLVANLSEDIPDPKDIKVDDFNINFATGKVSASVRTNVDTTLMKIAKMDTVDVGTTAAVSVGSDPIEVAMALDVTGSMKGAKLDALKTAAASAVEILIDKDVSSKARVSLVPYASGINVGPRIAKLTSNNASQRCVVERDGEQRYNDDSYKVKPVLPYRRADIYCPTASVQPLTADSKTLKREISGFQAKGGTAGHLGVAWAYYTLSPDWNSAWPADSKAAPRSDASTHKVAILMTDGEFNTTDISVSESSANIAQKTCNNMKADNIKIYSIMFAPDENGLSQDDIDRRNAARITMQNCATPNTSATKYFYQASSGAELIKVFTEIATSIKRFRLVQ